MERTFAMIKPDGIERGLIGEIISRFERRGFRLVGMKMLVPSSELAEAHYAIHKGKAFYNALVEFITSGPVVAMVLEADNAVALVREMIGSLNPKDALPGTIRGDYTTHIDRNLIHGADSPETAEHEIRLWFPELVSA